MNTYVHFVMGYIVFWLIPFFMLAYLITKVRKLEKEVKRLDDSK